MTDETGEDLEADTIGIGENDETGDDLDADTIGDIGESLLENMSARAGITANRAIRDRRGWDYQLQLPRPRIAAEPWPLLDLRAPEISCAVQVKTTRSETPRVRMKLSNWERLVMSPTPAFVFLVRLNAVNEVLATWLVHVDHGIIAAVLRRLRETDPMNADSLHKIWLARRPSSDSAFTKAADPGELLSRIRQHVKPDLQEYVLAKVAATRTIGYADHAVEGTVTFPDGDETFRSLADLAIGLARTVPIADIKVQDVRFGVARPHPQVGAFVDGHVEIGDLPSIAQTTIIASNATGTERATLACETYASSHVFPFLPPQFHKYRFAAPGFSMVLHAPSSSDNPRCDVDFTFPNSDVEASLDSAGGLARFMRLFDAASRGDGDLTFAVGASSTRSLGLGAEGPRLSQEALQHGRIFEWAAVVAQGFGLPPTARASPRRLGEQWRQLALLAESAQGSELAVTFPASSNSTARSIAALVLPELHLVNQSLLAAIAVVGEVTRLHRDGESVVQIVGRPRIMSTQLVGTGHTSAVDAASASAIRTLMDDGVEMVLRMPVDTRVQFVARR